MRHAAAAGSSDRLQNLVARLRDLAHDLECLIPQVVASADPPPAGDEFLSLRELCARIPYKEQTIRNLINAGELRNGVHFRQRRPYGKLVFVWSAMERWLQERQLDRALVESFIPAHHARTRKIR